MHKLNKKPLIMIVDDTPFNLEILEEILHGQGYQVAAFPKGEMALRAAVQDPPDLILLDIMMPEMDGFEVCSRLKSDARLQGIPVIFISALDDTANIVKAFTIGGIDYISKPFKEAEVNVRVDNHLKLRRSQQELAEYSRHLEDLVKVKVKEIMNSQMATLVAISNLAELRDDKTGQHIERTRTLCRKLALKMQENPKFAEVITDSFVDNIYYAAPLHDIGKIGIPDKILLKQGKLTHEEFEVMKTHVAIGMQALQKVLSMYPKNSFITMGVDLTRYHHEKWDGSGYPDKLKGTAIPLSARILALVDVYDALRSSRPYKEEMSHKESVRIIREGSGQHFDPEVVGAFVSIEDIFNETYER
ncbi:MAG TPA: HD domain-containing phosphohydrolase, partial [Negativicutes bacterium]|nr:HD domain-containing phosphohydrolase [Negativicutes bacterium]